MCPSLAWSNRREIGIKNIGKLFPTPCEFKTATMNSGSGIQELMAAETRASQIVAEARIGQWSIGQISLGGRDAGRPCVRRFMNIAFERSISTLAICQLPSLGT